GIKRELGDKAEEPDLENLPLLLSVDLADRKKLLKGTRALLEGEAKYNPVERKHRGTPFTEYTMRRRPPLPKRLYQAVLEKAYALAPDRSLIGRWIDDTLAHARAKAADEVEVNTSLYLAPPGGKNTDAISAALDWESHTRALSAAAAWQALYAAGAVTPRMS